MAKVNVLVVLANDGKAYNVGTYSISTAENTDVRFVNENNFDDFRGWAVNAVVFIGAVQEENFDKFQTLVRE